MMMMSNVRESDTSLWLHNKLGSNEAWSGGTISSQLNPEILRNIKDCFMDLQTPVKLKLLLSFFHIPRRNVEEWRNELEEIIEVAQSDSEQWVAMLAEIMKSFPSVANLNHDIQEPEENRRIFLDLVDDVTQELKRGKDLNLLPLECLYLNKSALATVVGQQKTPVKHFSLKRKPKSALLRAELIQKANDVAKINAKKAPAPAIPLRTRAMPRKLNDNTPMKGLPSQAAIRAVQISPISASRTLSRTSAGKKEGGVKLLEITEQPMGYALAKRRKKMQEEESKKTSATEESAIAVETPDYAAGLSSASRPLSPPPPTPLMAPPTPSPYQPPTPQPLVAPSTPMVSSHPYSRIPDGPPPTPNPQLGHEPMGASYLPGSIAVTSRQQVQLEPVVPAQPMTKTVILQVPTNQPQQIVTLSKELMEKAQEIFRTANKATRPEKEHILKFMAGTRDNPCPELGSIVTIKLSEYEEQLRQKDGTVIPFSVETHFQMNYNTGEWKVIQKPPKMDNLSHPMVQSTV